MRMWKKIGTLRYTGRNASLCSHYGKQFEYFSKIKTRTTVWSSNFTSGYIFKRNEITLRKGCLHIPIFTVALFQIIKTWKLPKGLWMNERINKCYMCMCGCVRVWVCVLSYVQLCDPMDCSLPGSSVHEIVQARIFDWVALFYSREYFQPIEPASLVPPALAGGFITTFVLIL